jgi:hypothetical protein
LSDPNEIVGHKTFGTGDPLRPFRHEPLTRKEADALWAAAVAAEEKRAKDMPTEQDAVNALWSAQERLKKLGWKDPRYAHELRKEGVEALLIELPSSGIHRGTYHAVNGQDVWWIGPDGSPSHPCLVKPIATADRTAKP